MKQFNSAIFLIAILFLTGISGNAQETNLKVVDEVVAQVNESVITLSRVRREMDEVVSSLVQEGKTPEEARKTVEEKRPELIANIINEELLLQKVKEYGLEKEVEARLNEQLLRQVEDFKLKTLDELYKEMERSGVDPNSIKDIYRKQISKDLILQSEVDQKVYRGWSKSEVQNYYEANKAKFTKPETITISEIYLSFAGRDEAAVREKAKQIVAQARKGADFTKLAVENSERPNVKETMGKAGTFNIKDLDERFAKPLENVKVGGITDPIDIDDLGLEIIRVDERSQASKDSVFNDRDVRIAMTYEKLPTKRKEYMKNLRADSYIKINETYRPEVAPVLYEENAKAETKDSRE